MIAGVDLLRAVGEFPVARAFLQLFQAIGARPFHQAIFVADQIVGADANRLTGRASDRGSRCG